MIFLKFLTLITRPKKALRQMLANPPSFTAIVLFLLAVSIIRGLLEVIRFYADEGLLWQLSSFLKSPSWHLFEFWPFMFTHIFTVYIRWFAYGFFVVILSKIFGVKVNFKMVLKVYGVLLGIYVFPVILNFIYLVLPLPVIRFGISKIYAHLVGVGSVVTSILFIYVSTVIITALLKIKRFDAFLISFAIPIIDRVVYVAPSLIFFNLPMVAKLNFRNAKFLEAIIFILASSLAIPIFTLFIRRFKKKQEIETVPEASLRTPKACLPVGRDEAISKFETLK